MHYKEAINRSPSQSASTLYCMTPTESLVHHFKRLSYSATEGGDVFDPQILSHVDTNEKVDKLITVEKSFEVI